MKHMVVKVIIFFACNVSEFFIKIAVKSDCEFGFFFHHLSPEGDFLVNSIT